MKIFCSLWSPLSKKHKISLYNFQMCLMARLKALGILRWNLGSDIEIHDLRSSAMVLIDVLTVNAPPSNITLAVNALGNISELL